MERGKFIFIIFDRRFLVILDRSAPRREALPQGRTPAF
jgi:hypothetical protein